MNKPSGIGSDTLDLIHQAVDAPRIRLGSEKFVVNDCERVPMNVAIHHARMATCAMLAGERGKAMRAIERAFLVTSEEYPDDWDDCGDQP